MLRKISDLLIGLSSFTIETDHEPLLVYLKSKHLWMYELCRSIDSRLELCVPYTRSFKLPGKRMVTAETISCFPVGVLTGQGHIRESDTELCVKSVMGL